MNVSLAFFGPMGGWELGIVVVIALLIFGRRLPDVARSVGKSIVEFKKGIRDVKNEIDDQSQVDAKSKPALENKSDTTSDTTSDSSTTKESSNAKESSNTTESSHTTS